MRKLIIIATVVAIVGICAYAAFAREHMGEGMMGMDMKEKMMDKDMMMKGPGMMAPQPQMVATSDGGVVVLMGCQLTRYDNDLNMVAKGEVKIDWEMMKSKMKEAQQHMQKMMKEDMDETMQENSGSMDQMMENRNMRDRRNRNSNSE